MQILRHPASFRDPAGSIVLAGDDVLRVVSKEYREEFERFKTSGLYETLSASGYVVVFEELDILQYPALQETACAVLRPQRIEFISYPYEWTFPSCGMQRY